MTPEQWIQLHSEVAQLSDTSGELAVELARMGWPGLDFWGENLKK